MKTRVKGTRLLVFAIIVAGVVVLGATIVKKRKAALENVPLPRSTPPVVQAVLPEQGVFPVTSHFLGTLKAKVVANISSRLQGNIVSLPYREGQYVRKGEILCLVDDRLEKARLEGVMARLAAAKTNLATQEGIYHRDKILFENKAISQEELDLSKAKRDAARGEVEWLEAELAAAKADLSYTRLLAPFSGVVTRRFLNPGDLVTPGMPVIQLESQKDGYYIEIKVPQERFPDFRVGQDVLISLKDHVGPKPSVEVVQARVSRLHPAVAAGGLATLEADLPERPFGLPTGSLVHVVVIKDRIGGLRVPVRAVLENLTKEFCFFIGSDSRVQVIQVEVLFMGEDYVLLKKGLIDPSMPVIVAQESTLLRLHQGEKVRVILKGQENEREKKI